MLKGTVFGALFLSYYLSAEITDALRTGQNFCGSVVQYFLV